MTATAGRYVKAVLWDMDGTLMNSQPIWDESFRRRCQERGGTCLLYTSPSPRD